jgi:transposase
MGNPQMEGSMTLQYKRKDIQKHTLQNEKSDKYRTTNLDHLGLIAAQFEDLGLVDLINTVIPQDTEKRHVSLGHAIKAMVVNGLGFSNHTLYLMPEFFMNKPVERLIGPGISAEDINQNLLGRCLDNVYDFDPTQLYSLLSSHVVKELNLPCTGTHIDSTSFHVDGTYNSNCEPKEGVIQITQGYSRDHRPDLNQVGLQLIVENQAGIPLVMRSLDGNDSDKASFAKAINTHINQFQTELGGQYIVGDSALYTPKSLKRMENTLWISRVPETLSDARWAIETISKELMTDLDKDSYCSLCITYAGVRQRWVVYYSPEAHRRALGSVNKQLLKSSSAELKQLKQLTQQVFVCKKDAQMALSKLEKKLKVTEITDATIRKNGHFNKKGRPEKDAEPDYYTFHIEAGISTIVAERATRIRKKSCFILATNQLDSSELDEEELIRRYKKDQQKVERGFRFLKDPQFLASTLFLNKPERIMGLLMIMTLSLLIYASLEYKMRTVLKEKDDTVPNQKGKQINNPTMRWIFQYFSGIHVLIINRSQEIIMNLNKIHMKILRLMGETFQKIYSGTIVQV